MHLDLRTVFAVCALCSILVGGAIVCGIGGEDRRRSGSGRLALAMLVMGSGLALEGTRGLLDPWISIFVANAMVGAGALLFWSSLRRLYELPAPALVIVLCLGLLMAVDGTFLLAGEAASVTRSVSSSLVTGLLYALPAALIVRRFDDWLGRAHYVVAAAMLAGSGALVARAVWGLAGPSDAEYALLNPHPMNVVFALLLLATIVLMSYGFLLMLRERDLLKLAMLDGLTGVMNRRAMMEAMEAALALALRTGRKCSVLLLDLDHFKRVNDTHGHAAGDLVLQRFAALVASLMRSGDVVGRYGGEEFALLLPGTPAEGALVFAERLRAALAARPLPLAQGALHVTASVGVAEWHPGASPDFARLLDEADRALYAAKQQGRDRAVRFDSLAAGQG